MKKLSVETDCLPRFAVEKSGEIGGRWENCRKTYDNVGFCNFRKKRATMTESDHRGVLLYKETTRYASGKKGL